MRGLTAPFLDAASQQAIVEATARTMGVATTSVSFVGAVFTNETRRVLLEDNRFDLEATFTADAETRTEVPLDTTGYDNADDAYNALTTALVDGVNDGSFTSNLDTAAATLNATAVEDATVTGVANSQLIVREPIVDDDNGDDNKTNNDDEQPQLNDGEIAGVIIAVVVFLAIVAGAVWYFLSREEAEKSRKEAFNVDTEIEIDL